MVLVKSDFKIIYSFTMFSVLIFVLSVDYIESCWEPNFNFRFVGKKIWTDLRFT